MSSQCSNGVLRCLNGRGTVVTHGQPFSAHDGDVGDAEETEEVLQVGLLMVEKCPWRRGAIHAAARAHDDHLLAAREPFN